MAILSCLTRDDDIRAARRAPCCLLEEATALSADDVAAGNIAIQGDKLDALRALLSFCAGVGGTSISLRNITGGRHFSAIMTTSNLPEGISGYGEVRNHVA